MDNLTVEQRKYTMSRIRSKNTQSELILRKALWKEKIRFRKHYPLLLGKPDIVITKYKIVIFIDGEFWHGKNWKNTKNNISTNSEYWIKKIEKNMLRDKSISETLLNDGWLVLRFWSRDVKKETDRIIKDIKNTIDRIKE